MFKIVTFILLITDVVLGDSFVFPDQVSSRADSESRYYDNDGLDVLNSYGDNFADHGNHRPFDNDNYRHRPAFNVHHNGNNGEFVIGHQHSQFGHHHSHNHRGNRQQRPYFGSQSEANAQSTGLASQANSQGGSQFFNGISQSNSQSQAQSQGYHPFGPNGGGVGASSASSAASATSGIIDGVATASAAASAASASSGGGASVSSAASSSSMSGHNAGFGGGQSQISPWFFRSRIAGEDKDSNTNDDNADSLATSGVIDDKLIFNEK